MADMYNEFVYKNELKEDFLKMFSGDKMKNALNRVLDAKLKYLDDVVLDEELENLNIYLYYIGDYLYDK